MSARKKIYLASSWRNQYQPGVLAALRSQLHEVYDFRNPAPGDKGFAWADMDPNWENWDREAYIKLLRDSPVAAHGYKNDWDAMEWADTGVLLLPSGRSAHLEAGYFAGHPFKELHILMMDDQEPELMYKMADSISLNIDDLLMALEDLGDGTAPVDENFWDDRTLGQEKPEGWKALKIDLDRRIAGLQEEASARVSDAIKAEMAIAEAERLVLSPNFEPCGHRNYGTKDQPASVQDDCPVCGKFYCDSCNYDRHYCHGCGEPLPHDNSKDNEHGMDVCT